MGVVKIEHAVGVQNKDFFSKCVSDGHVYQNIGHNQSKNCENKTEFCYKFCRIWPIGRLAAIIIDIQI